MKPTGRRASTLRSVCTDVCREHLLLAADNKCQLNPQKKQKKKEKRNPSRTGTADPTEDGGGAGSSPGRQTHRLAGINSWACLPGDRRGEVEKLAVWWGLC